MKYIDNSIVVEGTKETSIKLTKALLRKDYGPDEYALDLTYTLDSPTITQELHIPRMVIPLNPNVIKIDGYSDPIYGRYNGMCQDYFADLGFGEMRLLPDKNGAAFTVTTVKEKTREMTLDEIEKKLGHKVKIVSK